MKNVEIRNEQMVEKLNKLLANYQLYYQNLRGLHWNVKGIMFFGLHEKFEEYYNEAAEIIDEIAERILMIGGKPLHAYSDYLKVTDLFEVKDLSDGKQSVESVLENSRFLLGQLRDILEYGSEIGDEGTIGLMSEMIGNTEKRIWMLSSFLG